MIRNLRSAACCRRNRLPLFAILVALWAANGSPGFAAPPQTAPAQAAAAVQMDHISVQKVGKGPAVFLVPGLSSPREVWADFVPELAKTHSVYLVQVNGFGGDDPRANLEPGVLDGIVADVRKLIGSERLERPALVGHSMGGLVGLMLARAHPSALGKLMIVDSLPYVGVIFVPGATVAMIEPNAARMRDQMAAQFGKAPDSAAAAAIARGQALKPESQARVARWVAAADARVSARAFYEDATTDLRPDLGRIAIPITVVHPWGGMLAKERADALYRGEYASTPNVTHVEVADSGHFVMLDQPEAFRAALDTFLRR
jgi:pimeloyl-ACP methyl ester carboxylesterase